MQEIACQGVGNTGLIWYYIGLFIRQAMLMLRISKLTDYAILVMVELNAYHGQVMNAHSLLDTLPSNSGVRATVARVGLGAAN